MNQTILKTLVGSRAHKLNDETSDYDYRSVFVSPTVDLLKLGPKPKTTSWIEGDVDDTAWEIGHFLHLATKSNPTILEVFASPIIAEDTLMTGYSLCELFDSVWNSNDVYHAFSGYSKNQRKKLLDEESDRKFKYGVAYIRTLWMGTYLLERGELFVDTTKNTPVRELLLNIRHGKMSVGDIVGQACYWQERLEKAYKKNPDKQTDLEKVNEFLLEVRKTFWSSDSFATEKMLTGIFHS
ncbi:MAG: nucleotidyltransferase domain-containing protein [Methanogenium sp.]|jgi:hypothetical protein